MIYRHNWRYLVGSLLVFLFAWHCYSFFNLLNHVSDKFESNIRINSLRIEEAYLAEDVVALRNILGQVRESEMSYVLFNGSDPERRIENSVLVGAARKASILEKHCSLSIKSNGAEIGNVEYGLDLLALSEEAFLSNVFLYFTVAVFMFLMVVFANTGTLRTLRHFEKTLNEFEKSAVNGTFQESTLLLQYEVINKSGDPIIRSFVSLLERFSDQMKRVSKYEQDLQVAQSLSSLASQVAHDIRSPLAAIGAMQKELADLPEDTRLILRSAFNRIRDIANNLLDKNREIGALEAISKSNITSAYLPSTEEHKESLSLPSMLDALVSEKRMQFRSSMNIDIDYEMNEKSWGCFVNVNPVALKRLTSNLINNSVEAIEVKGTVSIFVTRNEEQVILRIRDDGKGISAEVLPKLGRLGETYGKVGGSGLGLYHARATVESWGGSLEIESAIHQGTTVTITLPLAEVPAWFTPEVELKPGFPVVVLDDDFSIHGIWQGRFESLKLMEEKIEVVHFSEPKQLKEWVQGNPECARHGTFLVDFEIIGSSETGLDIIEELKLQKQSLLVTSRFEESKILRLCQKSDIGLIPKSMAGFVPITIKHSIRKYEAVLIDDDEIVRMAWEINAKQAGLEVRTFSKADDFLTMQGDFDRNTPIYIDSNLGEGVKGEDISKKVSELGFKTIFLTTGYEADHFSEMPWLSGILGKMAPWHVSDQIN